MEVRTYEAMLDALRAIAASARHVTIDRAQLVRVAAVLRERLGADDFQIRRERPALAPADCLQFALVAGTHNFLIWQRMPTGDVEPWRVHVDGEERYGAPAIYACHLRALRAGKNILDPNYLVSMTLADMEDYYRDERTGAVTLQFLPERLAKFHEVGRVLRARYRGSFVTLFERAEGWLFRPDGQGIVQRLLDDFPLAYGDWPFCKLIMVTVGNLYADQEWLGPPGTPVRTLVDLRDPEHLEVGADYYRPFFLYRVGVLRVSEALREHLRQRALIPRDSPMEREYRAWTILATRELAAHLGVLPHALATETWAMGFMRCRPCHPGVDPETVPCDYRGVCRAYTSDPALMEALWPLVLTPWY
ncbi:MAG: queuosine salvage family protein [Armatimonadota bacterium]|nr:queuosine salvage family protein [Armatimonadota bacterium]